MAVLVVGGAGYIGSHMVKRLFEADEQVAVLDNLSTGFRDAVPGGVLVEGDTGDSKALGQVFTGQTVDVVMHFASSIQVGESVRDPVKYYRNNVTNTLTLLEAMAGHGVKHLVFSSSAAVYGNAPSGAITEDQPCSPVNPYGRSKWIVEQLLVDYDLAYGLKSVSLRYFNAAGADPDGQLGERHDPDIHLIPAVLGAASGRRSSVGVFGRDYPTPDGTCIRDYVHVSDLCDAHLLALKHLRGGGKTRAYNLGNGKGFSVQEVVDSARRVTGRPVPVEDSPRRAGDPPVLVADAGRIRKELGWAPRYPGVDTIIEHAWKWELQKGKRW